MQGSSTVRRKVTNVGSTAATYTASAAVPGFSTQVTPASLTLAVGASASFTLKLTANTAPANTWQFGSLSWTDGSHVVRRPVQARIGKAIVAPAEMNSDKVSGSKLFPVMAGFPGRMSAYKGGVKEVAPAGSWNYSGNDGSNESVQLASPAPGAYKVCVTAYASANPSMAHALSSWLVTPSDVGGKFVVALPSKSVAGTNTSVGMSWSGLELDKRYVGGAQFLDLSGVVQATTVLRVETGAASIPTAQSECANANKRD